MQAVKGFALQAAEDTGRQITERVAWFYLRHLGETGLSLSAAANALLTRGGRMALPEPQGEREKTVRNGLCTRFALLEAQIYDTINAYTRQFVMSDRRVPEALRRKMNERLALFKEETLWFDALLRIPSDAVSLLKGFVSAQQERLGQGTLAGLLDWLTIGMVSGLFRGLKERNDTLWAQPPLYHAVNWLTMGTADLVKGAVKPDEPLSLEHWLNSLGVASIVAGVWSMASSSRAPTTGQLADYAAKQPAHVGVAADTAAQRVELIRQMEQQGEKCTPENIIDIARLPSGKIVWLETGTENAGFNHILKHAGEFAKQKVSQNELADYIMYAVQNGRIVGAQGTREIYEVAYKGTTRRIAITIRDNGFIVGANPRSMS